ncbi:alpha/beta hydrolase [Salinimonas iocasae]|uniref:alpha/beta hydrolase n=1 Tax=Salinimonas iocasae TaxID=2572577 RepID=UPI001E3B3E9B|nr:alpha/beta fold hydrolase [Salinimonas iocasae]
MISFVYVPHRRITEETLLNCRNLLSVILLLFSPAVFASDIIGNLKAFSQLYKNELGNVKPCANTRLQRYAVCANALRNDGNGPFILHHGEPTQNVAVLFHGLSDSPYFMRAIAANLHANGFTVIVPLLPGHGLRDADEDMEDRQLAERWQRHVDDIMVLADKFGNDKFIGGFSTGGALAVDQYLDDPEGISGIMLFSGALALTDNAESMWKIWGIKTIASWIDGEYETHGPNPYKYPSVAGFAGLELMDIIDSIRNRLEAGKRIEVPLFVAHSQADGTTPITGVRSLLANSEATNTFFEIDEGYDLCHADLPLNTKLVADMHFKTSMVNPNERCAVPKANPLYRQMMFMLNAFIDANTQKGATQYDVNRPAPIELPKPPPGLKQGNSLNGNF